MRSQGEENSSSCFSQSFRFLNSESLQESFFIFPPKGSVPAAPLQSWLSPTWTRLIKTSLHKTFLLIKISLLIKSSAQMLLELRVGEPADPAWTISHFSDSSQEMPIFKEPLKEKMRLFFLISWVFTAKHRLPLWPLPYSDLLCWDVLVKLMLRSMSQILFRGRETNVPGSSLKASMPVGCVNGLVLHSCSSRATDVSKQPASREAAPVLLGSWVPLSLGSSAPLSLGSTPLLPYSPRNDKSMVIA